MGKTTGGVTTAERTAVRNAGEGVDPKAFDKEGRDAQNQDVFNIVELAAQYVSLGGTDPRAVKVFKAGQKAGHIDDKGNYIGPKSTKAPTDQQQDTIRDQSAASGADDLDGPETGDVPMSDLLDYLQECADETEDDK